MFGIVVAAHADLAQALLTTAQGVVPHAGPCAAVGVFATDDTASFESRLRAAVKTASGVTSQACEGVLILTDMFGGTPCNVSLTLHEPQRVEVLTGLNLSMLVKALQLSPTDVALQLAARQARDAGVRAISIASEVLQGTSAPGERRT